MANLEIKSLFADLQASGRKALVPYFTAGFPTLVQTERLVYTALDAGADLIEIGSPFTDPLADGPSIQYSSQWALDHGIRLQNIFDLCSRIRRKSSAPLIVMGYFNPLIAVGIENYLRRAADSGVSGLIIPDLPPDEAGILRSAASRYGVSLTFLVAPTSSEKRISLVDRASTDFVYAVTVAGVTGARKGFDRGTDVYLSSLRSHLKKPFVAGFGVSGPESAVRLARNAGGVVIGSALVDQIRGRKRAESEKAVSRLLGAIRRGLDNELSPKRSGRKSA